jgi:PhnB protein
MTRVPPVPDEFRTITPHLAVRGVAAAVAFYARAFGAEELFRNLAPDGKTIIHSEVLLGDSRFFLVDENPEWGIRSPLALGDTPVTLHLYVPDVDSLFARAVDAGAEVLMPLGDQFWGDRYGILRDPFGHRWSLASRIEDLSPAELRRRAAEQFGAGRDAPSGGE